MKIINRKFNSLFSNNLLTRKNIIILIASLLLIIILIQMIFPRDRLIPFVKIENMVYGNILKKDIISDIDKKYKENKTNIYFGNAKNPQKMALPEKYGLKVSNKDRIENIDYPLIFRLIPGSILWYGFLTDQGEPKYILDKNKLSDYLSKEIGESCNIKPKNANLKVVNEKLEIIESENGGTCKVEDVKNKLANNKPNLTTKNNIQIKLNEVKPDISGQVAIQLKDLITKQIDKGVAINVENKIEQVEKKDIYSWLIFNSEGKEIAIIIDQEKSKSFFDNKIAPLINKPAGITKITTQDFTEISRVEGTSGLAFDFNETAKGIIAYLNNKNEKINAVGQVIPPNVEYTRSYSPTDTGLSALIAHFVQEKGGDFGVQLIELSNRRRRAGFNENNQFVAASTYKLFTAYGVIKKIESGEWNWTDSITGGRNVDTCFNDMIIKSDNACAEALSEKIGYNNLTNLIRKLGLSNKSGFIGDGPKTTASDLALFLGMLESGQLGINNDNKNKFISALSKNVFRKGIPAGVNGNVADKVGFLNSLFHDAAIVYSPSGTYILVIMSGKSNWETIAELAKKIDQLRNQ